MYDCPQCGAEGSHFVWESLRLYKAGMDPKFIGCTACNEMTRL